MAREQEYFQDVTTVPKMSDSDREAARESIESMFVDHYVYNMHRFSFMYDGRATVHGHTLNYTDMNSI